MPRPSKFAGEKIIQIMSPSIATWAIYDDCADDRGAAVPIHVIALVEDETGGRYLCYMDPDENGVFEDSSKVTNFVGYCFGTKENSSELVSMFRKFKG